MKLEQTIRRILREETQKDLSPILENLLNKLLVKHNKDILWVLRLYNLLMEKVMK
jgi:uncharacterized membrane protein YheB (UPF0754 family)